MVEFLWYSLSLTLLYSVPQITEEPDSLEKPVEFVVKAIGKNLTYTWHCQTAEQLLPYDKRSLVAWKYSDPAY